jgi:hypothetical protein
MALRGTAQQWRRLAAAAASSLLFGRFPLLMLRQRTIGFHSTDGPLSVCVCVYMHHRVFLRIISPCFLFSLSYIQQIASVLDKERDDSARPQRSAAIEKRMKKMINYIMIIIMILKYKKITTRVAYHKNVCVFFKLYKQQ